MITDQGCWPRNGPARIDAFLKDRKTRYVSCQGYVDSMKVIIPSIEREHQKEGLDWRSYIFYDDKAKGHRGDALKMLDELNLWGSRIPAEQSGVKMGV